MFPTVMSASAAVYEEPTTKSGSLKTEVPIPTIIQYGHAV